MSLGSSESDIRPSEPASTGQGRLLQEGGVGNAERAWSAGTCSKLLPPMTLMTPQVNCQDILQETDLQIRREAALEGPPWKERQRGPGLSKESQGLLRPPETMGVTGPQDGVTRSPAVGKITALVQASACWSEPVFPGTLLHCHSDRWDPFTLFPLGAPSHLDCAQVIPPSVSTENHMQSHTSISHGRMSDRLVSVNRKASYAPNK